MQIKHLKLTFTVCLFACLIGYSWQQEDTPDSVPATDTEPEPEPEPEEVDKPQVMLATPCYGGLVTDAFYMSVVSSLMYYHKKDNLVVHASTVPGIADLPKARGALIYEFLQHPEYTHILFVDADIEFKAHLLERLAYSEYDVAIAMYPKKTLHWDHVASVAGLGGKYLENLDLLKSMALNYPVEWEFESQEGDVPSSGVVQTDTNGFAKVARAGAGFMMVKRSLIEKMVEAYPELHYIDGASGQTHYAFFHNQLVKKDNAYGGKMHWVSEDFAFCDRVTAVGGEIWVDLLNGLNHVGSMKFEGQEWVQRYRAGVETADQETPSPPPQPQQEL